LDIALFVVFVGLLYFLAQAFSELFSRTKIPDVLWLIIIGLFLGPVFHVVSPGDFGEIGPVFVTITLIVVLVHSGLGLRLETLIKSAPRSLALSLVNFLISTLVVGGFILLATELPPVLAFTLGAMVGGTSSGIVIPILKKLNMKAESSTILLLESALTDVLCIVAALSLLDVYQGGALNVGMKLLEILSSFLISSIIGLAAAFIWSLLLIRIHTIRDSVFTTFAFAFVVFGSTELLGFTGYIAALVFGIALGNIDSLRQIAKKMKFLHQLAEPVGLNNTEKTFFSETVFLLKTFFFIYIGISIQLTNSWWMVLGMILTLIVFVLRVPVVRFTISKFTPSEDASIMSVMVPKGLAAAALASIPLQRGIAGGDLIQSVVFAIVLFSILLTSILIFLINNTRFANMYCHIFSGFGKAPHPPPIPDKLEKSTDAPAHQ
jgi:potassium/hydrogen antiporter